MYIYNFANYAFSKKIKQSQQLSDKILARKKFNTLLKFDTFPEFRPRMCRERLELLAMVDFLET